MEKKEMYITLRNALAHSIVTAETSEYNVIDQTAFLYWVYCFKIEEQATAVRLINAYSQGKISMEDYIAIHNYASRL